jgi:hypothetical protein
VAAKALVVLYRKVSGLAIGEFEGHAEALVGVPNQVGEPGLVANGLARRQVAIERIVNPLAPVSVERLRTKVAPKNLGYP